MNPPTDRWAKAQEYERHWWDKRAPLMNLEYYRDYAETLLTVLGPIAPPDDRTRILEIGSGAAGIITFLPGAVRCAVDPLEEFYAGVPAYAAFRDPAVKYFRAMGEALPFGDADFDLVIMDNVLDHCADPGAVLREAARVLVPGGMMFFRQNVYHALGKGVRALMERFEVDKGHLHTFTRRGIVAQLRSAGFDPVQMRRAGYLATWWRELTAGSAKELSKALLFATRDKTLWVCRKLKVEG